LLQDLTDAERKALAQCRHAVLGSERPLRLDCGVDLGPYRVAYQTYGTLNAEKSNAILICHALTGDQFVADRNPVTGKEGWWENLVGPGKVLDPARYFIISTNVLGGCLGTTGPLANDPKGGQPWNLRFPVVTIGDMVRAQAALLDHLGVPDLFCIIGGSMGGMQVLEWAASHPKRVFSAVPRAIPRKTSRSTRSGGRRSWPIRNGRAATIACTRPRRRAALPWRA
jgi:homoserine O-acetyltransferase/O-succinyltransferase